MRLAGPPEPVRLAADRMTRGPSRPAERAADREVGVVVAVLVAGSEKAAAHRLGLSHSTVKHHLANARAKVGTTTTAQLVWFLAERLREHVAGNGGWRRPESKSIRRLFGPSCRSIRTMVVLASRELRSASWPRG